MNKDEKLFIEQIYLKYGKSKSHYKFIGIMKNKNKKMKEVDLNNPSIRKLIMSTNKEYIETYLDSKLKRLFMMELISRMEKKNGCYLDNQRVEIKFSDEKLRSMTTANKKEFYKTLNELIEQGALVKHKRSDYFINPYYFNNLSESQWEQLRNDFNSLWLSNQGIIGLDKPIE